MKSNSNSETERTCARCEETKPLDQFNRRKITSGYYRDKTCRDCRAAESRARRRGEWVPAPSGFSIPSTPEWGEIKRRANSLNPMSEEEISDTLGRKINDTDRLILIRVDHAKINTVVGLIPAVRFFDDGERRDEAFR